MEALHPTEGQFGALWRRQSWWHKPRGWVIHCAHHTACPGSRCQMDGPQDTKTTLHKGLGLWPEERWRPPGSHLAVLGTEWRLPRDLQAGKGRARSQAPACVVDVPLGLEAVVIRGSMDGPNVYFSISFLLVLAKSLLKFLLTISSAFSTWHLPQGI